MAAEDDVWDNRLCAFASQPDRCYYNIQREITPDSVPF